MLTFNSIDVETANVDLVSICQIGIAHIQNGEIIDQWATLVDPEDWFDPWNVSIHGIDETDVSESPTLPEVCEELYSRLHGSVLVSHTAFDRVSLNRAMARYNLEELQVTWLNSARIVRRAWPEHYARKGYGLANVTRDLGISFQHHDALEDAKAAAKIVLRACAATGTDIEGWIPRVDRPIFPASSKRKGSSKTVKRIGNVDGPWYGETVVFTGRLGMFRQEAADIAAVAGFNVASTVSKKVTILVVGVQNRSALRGYEKSSKHRKVETLVEKGIDIQILSESDFFELIGMP